MLKYKDNLNISLNQDIIHCVNHLNPRIFVISLYMCSVRLLVCATGPKTNKIKQPPSLAPSLAPGSIHYFILASNNPFWLSLRRDEKLSELTAGCRQISTGSCFITICMVFLFCGAIYNPTKQHYVKADDIKQLTIFCLKVSAIIDFLCAYQI